MVAFPDNGLRAADEHLHLLVGRDVSIADDAAIGGNVVIRTGTRIGQGRTISDCAVIGRQPTFGPSIISPREQSAETIIGHGAAVLAGALVLCGARVGEGATSPTRPT